MGGPELQLRAAWSGLLIAGSMALAVACSSSRAPELAHEVSQAATAADAAASVLPGYSHTLATSRFKIGTNPTLELNTPQMQRWRGSLGAFAIDPGNGSACGLLDAKSPKGPYEVDETTHGNNVKSYFVAAGVPADQIGEIQATYQSAVMGGSMIDAGPTPFVLESISSILRRRISGVLVAESEAWAKITTSGDVDMECVFWPPLDRSVIDTAVAWAKTMTDGPTHSSFLSRISSDAAAVKRDDGVVIHHTDMFVHSPAKAFVSYDVVLGTDPGSPTRHFDQNGQEFQLPHQQSPAPAPGAVRPSHSGP
jgi:hypothetical protein